MSLPYEYRMQQQLTIDVCKSEWPELLEFPFNKFPGVKNYIEITNKVLRRIMKIFK